MTHVPDMIRQHDHMDVDFLQRLGAGGQGEVWRVDVDGVVQAAKIYFAHTATDTQRKTIERLANNPGVSPHFLWPTALIIDSDEPEDGGFGYLMPLREPRFQGLGEIVGGHVGIGFDAALRAALNLADAFRELHTRGYAYRDINLNNVFIDPTNGDIAICDTDNVGIDVTMAGGVLGTSGFMAPEIEIGAARPSAETDRHSLAVLLFMLLVRHHPLEGAKAHALRCLDMLARRRLYGEAPLYVFDPADVSNRPTDTQTNPLLYRGIYPEVLWKTFERAFTEGLHVPGKRVSESGWWKALRATRDLLVRCTCGARRFVDPAAPKACWNCKRAGGTDLVLQVGQGLVGQAVVAADAGRKLDGAHLKASSSNESTPIGTFVKHPQIPNVMGLRNDTAEAWRATDPTTGKMDEVPPGKAVRCAVGMRVEIAGVQAVFANV